MVWGERIEVVNYYTFLETSALLHCFCSGGILKKNVKIALNSIWANITNNAKFH